MTPELGASSDFSDIRPQVKRRTWLYIVGGLVLICMMTGITLVVGGFMMFKRHVHTEITTATQAAGEFERAASALVARTPLVELNEDGRITVHRTPDRPRQPIESLHLLIYDDDEERLVRITVPGWLLRLAPRSNGRTTIRIDGVDGFDGDSESSISLEDLERHGPGLILDGHDRRHRTRLLAWVE